MMVNVTDTIFSDCGEYRYTLYRPGFRGRHNVLFCMANPSTAGANWESNDPTTKRALSFAFGLDCASYLAVNCFALISTDPKGLKYHSDPVGPMNDVYVRAAADWADRIVVAWGTLGRLYGRNQQMLELLNGHELLCLGRTKHGHPRFPLYLAADTNWYDFTNS